MNMEDTKPIARTRSRFLLVISSVGSFIFHPLFITACAILLVYRFFPGEWPTAANAQKWINDLLLYTVFLPFASILVLRLLNVISNARMHKPRDRHFPLIATMVFYVVAYWILAERYHASLLVRSLMLGSCAAIVVMFIINFFYKVSVHTTAAAILPGVASILLLNGEASFAVVVAACTVALFVGLIRWLLGAHTIGQIVLGYGVGIITQHVAYLITASGKL